MKISNQSAEVQLGSFITRCKTKVKIKQIKQKEPRLNNLGEFSAYLDSKKMLKIRRFTVRKVLSGEKASHVAGQLFAYALEGSKV